MRGQEVVGPHLYKVEEQGVVALNSESVPRALLHTCTNLLMKGGGERPWDLDFGTDNSPHLGQ